ncbi:thiamine phosphate synthase [Caulobacter segnis]|uniref:Thiamine monophosphate synthase n=1 Tax=Caulobacter segnis TaxID=88688 RepID=A0A2W5UZU0_9CAUL|nr:thiamine phosphate synthase [Caulobacter segnis]PZR31997.1 MAG: thiamine monophosphate synthase [Caulobacter segnis]
MEGTALRGDGELEVLSRTAAAFPPRTARGRALPNLLFFTDPARVASPEAVAERLPPGSGIVFRAFGSENAVEQGRRLRAIADARGLILLAGADPELAKMIGADGLHMPQRLVGEVSRLRAQHSDDLVTVAAHDLAAVQAGERAGADAVIVSPVFPSNSPSAGQPLGVEGLKALVAATPLPVYALGGVRADTVGQLAESGIVGIAAVEALAG